MSESKHAEPAVTLCFHCAHRQPQGDGMTHWYGCERGNEGCEHWEARDG